ncbi:MAG TPA: glycosyltransferase family 2 protein [Acidobacteriaceae bacterium]|nr:glycosyltransferase family 2 protein [Acidobacteriaceae bacterium]
MQDPMISTPLISVVIPTYNRARPTIAAIQSALAQTWTRVEILVIDDGSSDGSGDVLERFAAQTSTAERPILLLRQQNQGSSEARNTGISQAQGDYVALLDSDDTWCHDKLELQISALRQLGESCGACVTDARLVNDSGMDITSFQVHNRNCSQAIGIARDALQLLAESFCGFWTSSLLARTDILRQIGGFDRDIAFAEDRDLHFRLALVTSIAYVNVPLVRIDRTPSPPGSACRPWDSADFQFQQQRIMLQRWLTLDMAIPPQVRRAVELSLGSLYSSLANWHLQHARYREARQAMTRALRYRTRPGIIAKFALTWLTPAIARTIAPRTRQIGTGGHAS